MNTKRIITILCMSLILAGCTTKEKEEPYVPYENDNVVVSLVPMINVEAEPYQLSFKYKDSFFETDAKTYSQDLAELSYASSIATSHKEDGIKFFNDCGFKNIETTAYDTKPTLDTAGYFLAHKRVDNYELFVVAFRGFNYGQEWGNNLLIGKSGDHEGLAARANEAYANLRSYIHAYSKNRSLKLWINGYSRAGALSNLLSSLILRENKVNVTQENMYTYTFEAPKALSQEHALAYQNVHNIVNKADMIQYIAPEQYGLYRCGVDHEIYDSSISTLVKSLDTTIDIPEFEETTLSTTSDEVTLHNEKELIEFIIDYATSKEEESADKSLLINTREQYADNIQGSLVKVIGVIFALSDETQKELLADIKEKAEDVWSLISIISSGEDMLAYLSPFLDKDNVQYDAEALQVDLEKVRDLAFTAFNPVLAIFMGEQSNDLVRVIDMHMPETTYVLLVNQRTMDL